MVKASPVEQESAPIVFPHVFDLDTTTDRPAHTVAAKTDFEFDPARVVVSYT